MSFNVKKNLRKADSLSKKGDSIAAAALYALVLEHYPANNQAIRGLALQNRGGINAPLQPTEDQLKSLVSLFSGGHYSKVLQQGEILLMQYPEEPMLHNLMGAAHSSNGNTEAALYHLSKATKLFPSYTEAHCNLGALQGQLGQFEESISSYKKAVKLSPAEPENYLSLGNAYRDSGRQGDVARLEAAIKSYKKAIELRPSYVEAHCNLGVMLQEKNQNKQALESFYRAIELNPNFAAAHTNIGNILHERGQYEEAIASQFAAIDAQATFTQAHVNLGNTYRDAGELALAAASYKTAWEQQPEQDDTLIQMLEQLANICDWDTIENYAQRIPKIGMSGGEVGPFAMLAMEDSPARHAQRAAQFAKSMYTVEALPPIPPPAIQPAQLRIGYFSADFHQHATMHLMVRLFELHDQSQFVIHAYSFGPGSDGDMRGRLLAAVNVFHDVGHLNDREIAQLARSEGIDIAVDLKGYTKQSRFGIFAYGAAPIQVSYLGYPGTTGAQCMDYIVADRQLIPTEEASHYAEKIMYMPHSYQVNDSARKIADSPVSRAAEGLPEAGLVFCCFNNNYKIGPREFDVWMRLLSQVEGSVLWLFKSNQWAQENLCKEAKKRGVDPKRLVFAVSNEHSVHLARHSLADLFLDTFTYNAHTTASDALWSGVPLVTMAGAGFASRVAASLLSAVNLPELVTHSEQAYENLALELAHEPVKLLAIRNKLLHQRNLSPLYDTLAFTKALENAYQQAYQRYFCGQFTDTIEALPPGATDK